MATGMAAIRRVVTGTDEHGRSKVTRDVSAAPCRGREGQSWASSPHHRIARRNWAKVLAYTTCGARMIIECPTCEARTEYFDNGAVEVDMDYVVSPTQYVGRAP
ncbi:MAG: hypothetical protein JWO70_1686 [Betaproteobacteria bacterium]|nr:hypothetical protein [Betaproteobacteria bacterium]